VPEPFADLVVRVRAVDGGLEVTLADVCATSTREGAWGSAVVDVDARRGVGVVRSLRVEPAGDGALTARLLDGVGDALRARGIARVRLAAELDL
jgi:hypothetical protein